MVDNKNGLPGILNISIFDSTNYQCIPGALLTAHLGSSPAQTILTDLSCTYNLSFGPLYLNQGAVQLSIEKSDTHETLSDTNSIWLQSGEVNYQWRFMQHREDVPW